ncbi:amidohydrolase [Mammaliicoccus stepanovicii]|uniref:Putative peptidase n=1 Tax=Mammaliicoccus stepanovicii TaxID=643214 RepID=A0A240A7Y7_9STAP|nr:amidohydrolase [Mammaliicoccus stepanovicii]PNZ78029.1 peptidase M20 [Mammaliicoccus stepanovicii]GGI39613.1 peptidase M20 [Mammaliicoccus stepanovicii]SNV78996.1 putative peptidase [Mammaliicoccus stepanovicii]
MELDNAFKDSLIKLRRNLHAFPEQGFLEIRTANIVKENLTSLGYEIKSGLEVMNKDYLMGYPSEEAFKAHIDKLNQLNEALPDFKDGYTGIVATLDTNKPGPTIALRFDMDALPITESEDSNHYPTAHGFSSKNHGSMHACGHDVHTTIGIGLAKLLMDHKTELKGIIKLIFQPAEEGVRGAKSMVESGVVDDVDYFIGSHIGLNAKSNEIITSVKGFLASSKLDVEIQGVSSHAGAKPQDGKNALLAAATFVQQVYAIERHEQGASRVNVGTLQAGSGRNVIADKAYLQMEVRGENNIVNEFMIQRVYDIKSGIEAMFGVKINITKVGEAISIEPSENMEQTIYSLLKEKFPKLNIIPNETTPSGSEDATYYIDSVMRNGKDAIYMNIGSDHEYNHHHPKFDVKEHDMFNGISCMYEIVKLYNGN